MYANLSIFCTFDGLWHMECCSFGVFVAKLAILTSRIGQNPESCALYLAMIWFLLIAHLSCADGAPGGWGTPAGLHGGAGQRGAGILRQPGG